MASASPRLPQALTPTGLFRHPQVPEGILDSGKSSYSSVLVVLFRQIRVRNHRECCICACIWAWEYRNPGPISVPATSPEVKRSHLQRRTSPARTTSSCGASSCTHTRETRLTSRTTDPADKTPNLARIFKAPHPRKRLLSTPKHYIFVTVTKVVN